MQCIAQSQSGIIRFGIIRGSEIVWSPHQMLLLLRSLAIDIFIATIVVSFIEVTRIIGNIKFRTTTIAHFVVRRHEFAADRTVIVELESIIIVRARSIDLTSYWLCNIWIIWIGSVGSLPVSHEVDNKFSIEKAADLFWDEVNLLLLCLALAAHRNYFS